MSETSLIIDHRLFSSFTKPNCVFKLGMISSRLFGVIFVVKTGHLGIFHTHSLQSITNYTDDITNKRL